MTDSSALGALWLALAALLPHRAAKDPPSVNWASVPTAGHPAEIAHYAGRRPYCARASRQIVLYPLVNRLVSKQVTH